MSTLTLLIIDHHQADRARLRQLLDGSNYRVLEAADGAQGRALMQESKPDVVLCDIGTRHIDGVEFMQFARQLSEEIQIIVMSVALHLEKLVQALRFGADDYLIKPVSDLGVLQHTIDKCLERLSLQQENLDYREQLENANRGLRETIRVLEQDQLAGRQVQQKMLPKTPVRFGDYTFRHRIIPSSYLSGDFIDYFQVGDRHVAFVIADVSGHGASSAFVTVLLKNMFARKRSDYSHRNDNSILSPLAMMDVANRNLLNVNVDKYATICVGVIDLYTHQLTYSVGGHLPLPVLASDDEVRYLHCEGMPVGLFAQAEYQEATVALPENCVLSLFTDGILEVVQGDGVIEKERYLLEQLRSRPVSSVEVSQALQLDIQDMVKTPDDIAVLIIARRQARSASR